MKSYTQPSKELKIMFTEEWKRAKRLLFPLLKEIKRPKLYRLNRNSRTLGVHFGGRGTYEIKLSGRWVRNSHAIAIRELFRNKVDKRPETEIRETIRHEICHVLEQNHGYRFQQLLKQLV